jgi:hypothetical protein
VEEQEAQAPVLATCSIRSPVEAFENTQSRLLLLAASEEEYDRKRSPAYLHKGVTYTVLGILTCIRRLTGLCHEGLPHHFVAWTKSDTTSLLLVALTDQARSKSELVAENAFLRKPRIILRRRMIQPACTKTDGMILVFWRRRFEPGKTSCSLSWEMTPIRW